MQALGWRRALWLAAVLLTWLGCSSSSSDESGGRVLLYVANTGSTTVSVIDHETRAVVETIDVGASTWLRSRTEETYHPCDGRAAYRHGLPTNSPMAPHTWSGLSSSRWWPVLSISPNCA